MSTLELAALAGSMLIDLSLCLTVLVLVRPRAPEPARTAERSR